MTEMRVLPSSETCQTSHSVTQTWHRQRKRRRQFPSKPKRERGASRQISEISLFLTSDGTYRPTNGFVPNRANSNSFQWSELWSSATKKVSPGVAFGTNKPSVFAIEKARIVKRGLNANARAFQRAHCCITRVLWSAQLARLLFPLTPLSKWLSASYCAQAFGLSHDQRGEGASFFFVLESTGMDSKNERWGGRGLCKGTASGCSLPLHRAGHVGAHPSLPLSSKSATPFSSRQHHWSCHGVPLVGTSRLPSLGIWYGAAAITFVFEPPLSDACSSADRYAPFYRAHCTSLHPNRHKGGVLITTELGKPFIHG